MRARKCTSGGLDRWLAAGAAALALAAVASAGLSAAGSGEGRVERVVGSSAPASMDWLDDLIEQAKKIKRTVEEAEEAAMAAHSSQLDPAALAAALERAEGLIEQLLDPAQLPNLDPADAGSVDAAYNPATLAEYADDCVVLATEALDELDQFGTGYDADFVGSRFKTIRHLLLRSVPHNYGSIAGL